jgi:aldehyde:ferredoxin oxidoreductase
MYTPEIILQALASAGFQWSADDLNRFGADVLKHKLAFKTREGFNLSNLRIPERILETPTPLGKIDKEFLRKSIEEYGRAVQR